MAVSVDGVLVLVCFYIFVLLTGVLASCWHRHKHPDANAMETSLVAGRSLKGVVSVFTMLGESLATLTSEFAVPLPLSQCWFCSCSSITSVISCQALFLPFSLCLSLCLSLICTFYGCSIQIGVVEGPGLCWSRLSPRELFAGWSGLVRVRPEIKKKTTAGIFLLQFTARNRLS